MVGNDESGDIIHYYAKRALEYENIYLKPERQDCIEKSKTLLQKYFKNKSVLEIACGTGFWTEKISETAGSILAIDINSEVLEVAKNKKYRCDVNFLLDDCFELGKADGKYDSLFAGFWFSHIPKSKIKKFFDLGLGKLNENGLLVFMDNIYVEGSSTPISGFDAEGNSYQTRELKDKSRYEVLKNFYNENELKGYFDNYLGFTDVVNLKYFWIVSHAKTPPEHL